MIRISLLAALAVLLNLVLFMLMSAMIRHSQMRLGDMEVVSLVDFIRTQVQEPPPPPEKRRSAPEPPEPAPLTPLPLLSRPPPVSRTPFRVVAPRVDLDLQLQLDGGPYMGELLSPSVISAQQLTPLVTMPPLYPPSARARRLEGYAEVEFTVTENGSVTHVQVVDSDPAGVFDRAAERAVRRWKFQAHAVDGEATAVRARQRINFQLDSR